MDKYKIVGLINLVLGIGQLITVVVIKGLLGSTISTFEELGQQTPALNSNLWVSVLVVLFGIVSIFVGMKLFSNSQTVRNKYFSIGIIVALISFLIIGFHSSVSVLNILNPVNSLYSQ